MKKIALLSLMLSGILIMKGQPITGIKSIPGDYPTIANAIAMLNALGTTAPGVTFNVASGFVENGINMVLNTTTSSASAPIVFRKVPGGNVNPRIIAFNGVWNSSLDGAIIIAGSDFVTFDGIDITANDNTVDWGYALLKRNSTAPFNGCQNVTIRNCNISMLNTVTSYGIYAGNHTTVNTNALTITASTDACNYGKFYNNHIANVCNGISLSGFSAPSPYTLYDQGNEIGVDGTNVITNFGGGYSTVGIYGNNQNGIIIANNSISSGSYTALPVYSEYGIYLAGGSQANGTISNNTLSFNMTTAGNQSLYCIFTQFGGSGTTNQLNIINNTIQNCNYFSSISANLYCISNTLANNGPGTINISNNVIHDINLGGYNYFYGIDAGAAANINVQGNTIYNLTSHGSAQLMGIRCATGNMNISNNIIHDLRISSGNSILAGIYEWASPTAEIYSNNQVYNLIHTGTGTVYGIGANTTGGTRQTFGNTIHGLSSAGGPVYGMWHQASTPSVHKNIIYNLTSTTSAGQVYGMYFGSGSGVTVFNNYISDLKAPASTSITAVSGITLNGSNPTYLSYNTIYLNATSSSATTFGTNGIWMSTNFPVELRNNIVVNNSVPVFVTGPAFSSAIQRNGTNLSNLSSTSDNNCYYAGTPGPNNLIFYDGTNADQSISLYKVRVTPKEVNSKSALPPFVDPANHNFHIQALIPTITESAGSRVTTPVAVANDFDSDTRWGEAGYAGSGTATDIGADEGNFTPMASMAFQAFTLDQITGNTFAGSTSQAVIRMKITVTGSTSPVTVTKFTCNAAGTTAITDINATPSKIYFTGNSSIYGPGILFGSLAPTLTDYSINGSQSLTPGDNYFWLVFDIIQTAQTGHLLDGQCINATIAGTVKVPTVNSPAGNLMILGPMSGTYLVGTGNTYPNFVTLTEAINNINHRGSGGPVIFSLTNPSTIPYNATNGEVFPITVGVIPMASAVNTTTVKPAASMSPVISGSSATSVLILNGTDYFTINGSNSASPSRNLLIENTRTSHGTAAVQIAASGSNAGATFCTIKNSIIRGGEPGSNSAHTYALAVGSSIGTAGYDNDNLTIENNEISRAFYALHMTSNNYATMDNVNVSSNTIGSDDPSCYVGNTGVTLIYNSGGSFNNNVIKGVTSAQVPVTALYIGLGVKNMSFMKNDIHSISTSGNGNGPTGIYIDLGSGDNNLTIANNVLYDITGVGSSNLSGYGTAGIKIMGGSTNVKLYYNSICLSGLIDKSDATTDLSAAIYVGGSVSQLDVRNNIFYNSIENKTGVSRAYVIYCAGTSSVFTSLDYNDYLAGGREGILASYNGSDKTTLSAWKAASGKDVNSVSVDPGFNSTAVLIPYPGSPVLDLCPAVAVTDDFIGIARTVPTSIGAYEAGNDVTPPVAMYSQLYNTNLLTPRTLIANIQDYYSTVPTAGTGLPRLYWRINNNPYSVVTGVWTSGNTYLFTFGNSVQAGNTVSYFIVSQDNMPLPNVGATPGNGASGFSASPPACSTPSSTPSAYMITGALSGIKNIPGDYPNLTGANGFFADMNSKTLNGNLTVKIVGNLTEDGLNALNEVNVTDPSYKLTIVNTGTYHVISGSCSGGLIRFNGTDNVTLNGKGKLRIANNNPYPSIALAMSGNCNYNTIDSCCFSTGTITYPGNAGISITGPSTHNLIRNDTIYKSYCGIYLNSGYWNLGFANSLYNNCIGSTVASNYLFNNGIMALYQENLLVSKNKVLSIIGNNSPMGIYGEAITNSVIEKNDIRDIVYNGTSYGGASGITIKSLSSAPGVMIRNNLINHIAGMGSSPNTGDYNTIPAGIKLFGSASSGISIYNNSIHMIRDLSYGLFYNNEWFTAVEVGAGVSGVVMKNNIIQNSVGEWPNSNITSWGYAVYCKGTSSPFASINNNIYFTSNFDNNYVGLNAIVVPPVSNLNLSGWMTYTGQDAQSLNTDPLFTSSSNMTPLPASPAINAGLPSPGIVDDDILGNARGSSVTIGAIESIAATTKTLHINLLIQGLYSGAATMRAAWGDAGPYWGPAVADHIDIELHSSSPGNYASVIYTASDVSLSTTGLASAFIPSGFSGYYYLTVRHRNALQTTSAAPVSFSGNSVTYNFDAPSAAYGNKLVALPGGGYGIYSGDVNQDGVVNSLDMNTVNESSGLFGTGYLSTDINGDGTVDSADMTWIDNNAAIGITASTP